MIYPEKLHDLHRDFPLAPEKIEINFDLLSPTQKKMLGKRVYKSYKLVSTFRKRKNYVVFYMVNEFTKFDSIKCYN